MVTTAILALLFAAEPGCEIIQVADWHWISEATFVADGGKEEDYPAFLDKVDAIQREQMAALRKLKAKTVWVEGESDETIVVFRPAVSHDIWDFPREFSPLRQLL